jgi:hypothetical protein
MDNGGWNVAAAFSCRVACLLLADDTTESFSLLLVSTRVKKEEDHGGNVNLNGPSTLLPF